MFPEEKTSINYKRLGPRFGVEMLFWIDKKSCELERDV